jgi:hypothetical protein
MERKEEVMDMPGGMFTCEITLSPEYAKAHGFAEKHEMVPRSELDKARESIATLTRELEAVREEKSQPCRWTQEDDSESDTWSTSCGQYYVINDGTPRENDMKFCSFCGKPLIEEPYVEPPDEED